MKLKTLRSGSRDRASVAFCCPSPYTFFDFIIGDSAEVVAPAVAASIRAEESKVAITPRGVLTVPFVE